MPVGGLSFFLIHAMIIACIALGGCAAIRPSISLNVAPKDKVPVEVIQSELDELELKFGMALDGSHFDHITTLGHGVPLPEDRLYLFVYRYADSRIVLRPSDRVGNVFLHGDPAFLDPKNRSTRRSMESVTHVQLNAGGRWVWSAGELEIQGGRITWISNASGHFQPPFETLACVVSELVALGYTQENSIDMKPH